MTQLEKLRRIAIASVSSEPCHRSFHGVELAAVAFGMVLLAPPIHAQTVPAAAADLNQASTATSLSSIRVNA